MGGGSKKVTTGYRYKMGLHFGICHGPVDALGEIRVGDRIAWSGQQTSSGPITINVPQLFGGDKREGGIQGTADVMMGEPSQAANSYLASKISGLMPAFRGILGLVYKGGYVGSNNPYVKPWAFKVTRILAGWGGQQVTTLTEYSNAVLYPWLTVDDPRACKNDHEYSHNGFDWTPDIEAAKAAFLVANPAWTADQFDEYLGWSRDGIRSTRAFLFDTPEEREVLYLHFNRYVPDHPLYDYETGEIDQCVSGSINAGWWWQPSGNSYGPGLRRLGPGDPEGGAITEPGELISGYCIFQDWGDTPTPFLGTLRDARIRMRRVPRAPDDPCEPRCDDPFPDYPPDASYCLIDSTAVKRGDWTLTAGAFKALASYTTVFSGGYNSVTQYPIGPVLPSSDPNYSDEAYWTAQYNAAVTAGTTQPGKTYSSTGTGGANTYPRLLTAAYTRSGGTIVEGDPWNPDYAQIDAHMNPAHIVYQCLTNTEWGMGYPTARIDEPAFLAAAETLYDEEFGLSMIWNQQAKIGEFVQTVLDHIGAVLYADPRTGKFVLKLIRADYDPEELELYDESNVIELASFQRAGYGETVNEITVVYTDATTDKDAAITVQDLANVQAQGGVVSQTKQYPGIRTSAIAARVAERDLIASSTPLAKARIRVNRSAWSKVPGDVIKLNWDKLGIEAVIFRVLAVNYGTLTEGAVTIEIAEDVFGLPASSYAQQEPGSWEEPDNEPDDVDPADLLELPYWDVARTLSAADLDYVDDDAAYIGTLGARGNSVETDYSINTRIAPADYEAVNTGDFAPTALLDGAIGQTETEIPYTAAERIDEIVIGGRALIGTGRAAEFVVVEAVDTVAQILTVSRGILDTTPQEHADGARIWFLEDATGVDETERATGEEIDYKLTAVAPGGESDIADATEMTIIPDQRFFRPYPPGKVEINGEAWPTLILGSPTVTWAHRDRLQQTVDLVDQDEDSIGPEAGTTYNARLYDDDTDTLLDSDTGISGTTWAPSISGTYNVRLELEAERDGVVSWQAQLRYFTVVADDIILTEGGDAILAEDGGLILME